MIPYAYAVEGIAAHCGSASVRVQTQHTQARVHANVPITCPAPVSSIGKLLLRHRWLTRESARRTRMHLLQPAGVYVGKRNSGPNIPIQYQRTRRPVNRAVTTVEQKIIRAPIQCGGTTQS
jgi:hypothetical protein